MHGQPHIKLVTLFGVPGTGRLRGGRDAMGTQPRTEAILLSGRGLLAVRVMASRR